MRLKFWSESCRNWFAEDPGRQSQLIASILLLCALPWLGQPAAEQQLLGWSTLGTAGCLVLFPTLGRALIVTLALLFSAVLLAPSACPAWLSDHGLVRFPWTELTSLPLLLAYLCSARLIAWQAYRSQEQELS